MTNKYLRNNFILHLSSIHEYGCVGSRMRLRWLTNTAALAYEYGCVASQIRVRESVIHVSFIK